MTDSYDFTAGKNFADLILKFAEPLKGTLPGAHATFQGLSQQIALQAERNERHRIATILDGTHSALQPVIYQASLGDLTLYREEDHQRHRDSYAFHPLFKTGDKPIVPHGETSSAALTMINRFMGVVIRKILTSPQEFNEKNAQCSSIFNFHRGGATYTEDGKLTIAFRGEGMGFDNTLVFGPDFVLPGNNEHHARSLYFNETFQLNFNDIGQEWFDENIMHPLRAHFEIAPIDYLTTYSERAIIENLRKIDGIDELTFVRKVSAYYPGDEEHNLPETRIEMSYHHFIGNDNHQLIINWHPHYQFAKVGMATREAVKSGKWHNMPAPMQHWVFTNINELFTGAIKEYREDTARIEQEATTPQKPE